MTETLFLVLIFGIGIFAGFVNTLAGGGSLVVLPILILSGLPPDLANGTNRVAILVQTSTAVLGFRHKKVFEPKLGLILGIAGILGAIPGVYLALELSDEWFERILAIIMVLVGSLLIFDPSKRIGGILNSPLTTSRKVLLFLTFLFVGVYGGFVQAGVGFVILALLKGVGRMDLVRANALKVFVVLIYTLIALGLFWSEGNVDLLKGGVLAGGNAIGAWFGSQWAVRKGERYIKWVIAAMILVLAVRLWL